MGQIAYTYCFSPKTPLIVPKRGGFIFQLNSADRIKYGECYYYFGGINHDEFWLRPATPPDGVNFMFRSIKHPTKPDMHMIYTITCIENE